MAEYDENATKEVQESVDTQTDKTEARYTNHVTDVPQDERNFAQQAAEVARQNEAALVPDDLKAGPDYLFPDNYVNAQNPRKTHVLDVKDEPSDESADDNTASQSSEE